LSFPSIHSSSSSPPPIHNPFLFQTSPTHISTHLNPSTLNPSTTTLNPSTITQNSTNQNPSTEVSPILPISFPLLTPSSHQESPQIKLPSVTNHLSAAAKRLTKEFNLVRKTNELAMFRVELVGDDLNTWEVTMPSAAFFETSFDLFSDLEKYNESYQREAALVLMFHFRPDYPSYPPFVRVVRPRFQFHTGHITIGGSICIQVLTTGSGNGTWKPDISMASLILQLYNLIAVDGKGRVDFGSSSHPNPEMDYSVEEAKSAFKRVAQQHGWKL
jgi:ubiquitin-protein ligase